MRKNDWELLIQNLISEGILHSPRVIRAMRHVNRELFVPNTMKGYAAADSPLPIGWGQTISAPHD